MTDSDMPQLRICPQSLAADAYETDSSTGVIGDSLDVIENLDAYNRWVFDLLSPYVTGRVLEVGCGTGNITRYLADQADEVVGIDPVARFVDRFRQKFDGRRGVRAVRCTLEDMPEPHDLAESFDTVVSCNVFEHIEDDVSALRQVAAQLKPGGRAVIFVPAGPMAFGKLDRELGHYRRYTLESLKSAMNQAGLVWESGRYSNAVGLFGWWFNSRVLKKSAVPGDQAVWFNRLVPMLRWFERWLPLPFGQSVVGVARKPLTAAQPNERGRELRKAA